MIKCFFRYHSFLFQMSLPKCQQAVSNMSDLDSPDGFIQRVVEFEAEAVFLGGSLNQLACTKQDSAHPVIRFGSLVDQ